MSDVLSVRVDPEMIPRLDRIVKVTGLPLSTIVRIALRDYLEKIESEGKITISIEATAPDIMHDRTRKPK